MHFFVALVGLGGIVGAGLPGPSATHLTPAQQELYGRLAADEYCGCASALTIAGCLEKRPDCAIAKRLSSLLVRSLDMGATQPSLETFMSQIVLGPYCSPPMTLDTAGAPRLGKKSAPITVVEFADFRCSHCRHAVPLVHKALESHAGKVQLIYMPVALVDNELSLAAAHAALAANAQGKFWEMHAALFAREAGDFSDPVLREIAQKVGLNMKQFDKDTQAHRFADMQQHIRQAMQAGNIDATPAFFINGRRYEFNPDFFTLDERLDMEGERDQTACK